MKDKLEITGRVIAGGDTTPEGLFDVPRRFVYEVRTNDGKSINLTYTAFPPSPAGDVLMKKIRLDFHEGRVLEGHTIRAYGTYDDDTLTVAEEGDFIETSS